MTKDSLYDAPVFADTGKHIGKVFDESTDEIGILTTSDSRFWVPKHALKFSGDRWVLEGDYTELPADEPAARRRERELDEASEESFPASDPPDFTLGDEGKGA